MPKKSTTQTPSDPDTGGAITLQQAKAQARHVADRTLREAHQTEWNGYFQQQLKARNVEWSPKPTQEELDLAQLRELVEKYPTEAQQSVINFRQEAAGRDWPGDQGFVEPGVGEG